MKKEPNMAMHEAIAMIEAERHATFYRYPAMNAAAKLALVAMREKEQRDKNLPLTLDELTTMKTPFPVYVQAPTEHESGWIIYHGVDPNEDDLMVFDSGDCYLTGQVRENIIKIFRYEPNPNISEFQSDDPQPLTVHHLERMHGEMIYIKHIGKMEGIGRDIYAPYYGRWEKYIHTKGGCLRGEQLLLENYGTEWLAYATKPGV